LYFDLLGYFPAGINPVTFEGAENAIEAALFDLESAFKGFNHLPVGTRIFQVHLERWRIGGAGC